MRRIPALLLLAVALSACPPKKPPPPPPPSGRCEVDLDALNVFDAVGAGASARTVEGPAELIGGPYAQGRAGDTLLENERIRVIIQQPGRAFSAAPWGGNIIDADIKRSGGAPGQDSLGKLMLFYGFGRTIQYEKVEILRSGEGGGLAVVAATGPDTLYDYINIPGIIGDIVPGVKFPFNPDDALPLTATTYYVLAPGESRVRILTAFCNAGTENVVVGVGDLVESGGAGAVFNNAGCSGTLGSKGCFMDPMVWFGHQYDAMAYGVRPYKFQDLSAPEKANAVLYIAGVTASLTAGEGQSGAFSWLDASATRRPGAFGILAGQSRNFLRDFVVGKDLAEVNANLLFFDNAAKARVNFTVTHADGTTPAAGARIAVAPASTGKQEVLLLVDANGKARTDLPPGNYTAQAALPGRALENPSQLIVPSSGSVDIALETGAVRTLTVNVKDPFGAALSAKVVVSCPSDPCPFTFKSYRPFWDLDDQPTDVAAISYVPPQGSLAIALPPGQYQVRVMRGPEYSMWPDTAPQVGATVDLSTADQTVNATLAKVVDTAGWMSADLHVHAVNSPDSDVPNTERALSYLAEGVDVLVSTDHDFITDFAPVVRDLGGEQAIATMIGVEMTPFDYGHQQAYPLVRREDSLNGGALDWAGGAGPGLRLDQMYAAMRADHPNVVLQLNHPRGLGGSLTQLKVDTATGATHADAISFRTEPHPMATAGDTRLLPADFDAIEVMNGTSASLAVMNDWMTFLSRGWRKTATATSDSHHSRSHVGGYGRTWVKLGVDAPSQFSPDAFATALKANKAFGSNGPILKVTAQPLGSGGAPVRSAVEIGDTVSVDPGAGETLELTIDVQAPEWMTFDTLEVYTHAPGREALNGASNSEWPASRIHRSIPLDPSMLTLEAVPGLNGFVARKIHVSQTLTVSPTADTWYVVFVRGVGGGAANLYPLEWDAVSCDGNTGQCAARSAKVWAYSNPIFVDANGTGAYDDFPIK